MGTKAEADNLTRHEAARIADRLHYVISMHRDILRDTLMDLPDADIDVLRGLVAITNERVRAANAASLAVI